MTWSERQRAMLREMGLPAWLPTATAAARVGPDPSTVVVAAEPGPARSPSADTSPAPSTGAAPVQATRRPVAPAPSASSVTTRTATSTAESPPVPATTSVDLTRAAGLGWDELRAAVAACQACGLCQTRRQTVFGVGHPRAHWMVVGEAPGEQEDLRGEPFVGAAGQLLDRMLASIGLTRAEVGGGLGPAQQAYIANTLKCRPPRNRNPEPAELAQCEPFLVRQIELLQPKVILAMGRFAIQALLRSDEAVGRLRGRVHRYQGVPLVVTYHPAYLLRNPADKAKAWDDLCLAASTMEATVAGM